MKVLGKSTGNSYICEVTHVELIQLAGKYYGVMPDLEVGDVFDLGAGYNFHDAIRSVGNDTVGAIRTLNRHMPMLTQFMALVGKLPKPTEKQDALNGE